IKICRSSSTTRMRMGPVTGRVILVPPCFAKELRRASQHQVQEPDQGGGGKSLKVSKQTGI
ncbi:MAG: hypothetical protein PVG97_05970, partial [Syntrophobacterales bacterium]